MAEALLRANPAARVIATSRELLRVEGEWAYAVPPLAVPAEGSPDGEDSLRYGAVRLFVERARAAAPHFASDPRVADPGAAPAFRPRRYVAGSAKQIGSGRGGSWGDTRALISTLLFVRARWRR
jgi:hypothetical protein